MCYRNENTNNKFSMKILGIDYGRSKIGLAIGIGSLAEPFKVIRVNSFEETVEKVIQVIKVEQIEKVIVGISEGEMAEETRKFLSTISNQLSTIKFETFDETLTSQDAQRLSMEARISRKKRHEMEDAFAASIILQNYLDSRG